MLNLIGKRDAHQTQSQDQIDASPLTLQLVNQNYFVDGALAGANGLTNNGHRLSENPNIDLYHFPADVVLSIRHMVTKLKLERTFPKRVSMISAQREEGVTFTTLAMATVMANDLVQNVCVVDLNWWWPAENTHVVHSLSHGIAPILAGDAVLDEALVRTNFPNLSLLPAGELSMEQRPVAARQIALQELMYELNNRFDYLLLDIPAILSTSDAIELASLGDACCVVTRHGVSSLGSVSQALDEVRHLNVLGVMLNRVDIATPSWLLKWIPQD